MRKFQWTPEPQADSAVIHPPTPGIAGGRTRRPRLCRLGAVTGPRPGGFRIGPPTPVELPPPPVRSVGPATENEGGNATQTRPLRQGGSFLLPNSVPSPKQPPQTESFTKPPRPDKPPFRKRGGGGINPHATATKRKNHQPTPGERKPPFRKRGVGGITPAPPQQRPGGRRVSSSLTRQPRREFRNVLPQFG